MLSELPLDVALIINYTLSLADISKCSRTCKSWLDLFRNQRFWKTILFRDFGMRSESDSFLEYKNQMLEWTNFKGDLCLDIMLGKVPLFLIDLSQESEECVRGQILLRTKKQCTILGLMVRFVPQATNLPTFPLVKPLVMVSFYLSHSENDSRVFNLKRGRYFFPFEFLFPISPSRNTLQIDW